MRNNLVIDIENSFKAAQSKGYENWAKQFNLKVAANTINFLTENNMLSHEMLSMTISEKSKKYSASREKLKEMDNRIKLLEEQIHEIDVYRKTKPVVEGMEKVVFKEKYKKQHESDFILYAAAERSMKKYFGGGKIPLIKTLRAEQNDLKAQRAELKSSMDSDKKELDELRRMQRNIDIFLGKERQAERTRSEELS